EGQDDVSLRVLPPAGGSKATYRFDSPARGEGARRRIAPSPRLREGARRRIALSPRLRERARRRIASSPPPPAGEGWVGAADAAALPAPSDRQMLDRGHAAQPRGQALEQGQAVATHRLIIDVDHHAVEERI